MCSSSEDVLIGVASIGRSGLVDLAEKIAAQMDGLVAHDDPKVSLVFFLNNHPPYIANLLREHQVQFKEVDAAGYADVRNRVLDYAIAGGFQTLIFFDDDQLPGTGWLSALIAASRASRSEVVAGPVYAVLPRNAPKWASANPLLFRNPGTRPSGPYSGAVASGNTLLKLTSHLVAQSRFDASMNYGGEDTLYFENLRRAGATFWYASEAVAFEEQDPSRLTIRGYWSRQYQKGTVSGALTNRHVFGSRKVQVAKRCVRLLLNLGRVAVAPRYGLHAFAKVIEACGDIAFNSASLIETCRSSVPQTIRTRRRTPNREH